MATKRRTTRERKAPVKYFKEDSSDDDEAGSHVMKAAKLKLKQMMNEDSDAESDFETEAAISPVSSSDDSDTTEISCRGKKRKSSEPDIERLREAVNGDRSLCLSESDSDEEERIIEPRTVRKRLDAPVLGDREFFGGEKMVDGVEDSSQKLLELAGNLERMKDVWKPLDISASICDEEKSTKGNTRKSNKSKNGRIYPSIKTPTSIKVVNPTTTNSLDSISKLLAVGEGVTEDPVDVSEDESVPEPAGPVLPQEGVEITVPIPGNLRKKKRKGFDVAAFLKRELAKARRELSLLLHKSHITCLLAHLFNLNTGLTTSMLQGLALSIVPESHCHNPEQLTLTRLGSLVAWVREAIPVNRHKVETITSTSITTRLTLGLESMLVMTDTELVLMFVLICRSLGYEARIVLNCNTLPLKPSNDSAKGKVAEVEDNKLTLLPPKTTNSLNRKSKPIKKKKLEGSCSESEEQKETKPLKGESSAKNNRRSSKLAATVKPRTSSRISSKSVKSKVSAEIVNSNIEKKDTIKQSISELKPLKDLNTKSQAKCCPKSKPNDYWAEVFLAKDNKWVTVDMVTGKMNCATEMEGRASKPMLYVFAINNASRVKDVTQRYAVNFLTQTRKLRIEQDWVDQTLLPFKGTDEDEEDRDMAKKVEDAPLPTSVAAFKGHPLYVLQRHLLKFEAIYPATAPTLGFIKGEGVYARECVHTLLGRTAWLKEGRVVRLGEDPYKVVKARPKWDRMTGSMRKDEPLDIFGFWQTELYIPPPAKEGKVPRNEYGNVELFKPWMLPVGCVQIPINGMSRVIRQTGIDAAPAMVGWDFSGGGSHPVFDGYVVCEENAEALMDAWTKEQEAKVIREKEKREKRVLDNWKRLVKGLMFREKIQLKYMKD